MATQLPNVPDGDPPGLPLLEIPSPSPVPTSSDPAPATLRVACRVPLGRRSGVEGFKNAEKNELGADRFNFRFRGTEAKRRPGLATYEEKTRVPGLGRTTPR